MKKLTKKQKNKNKKNTVHTLWFSCDEVEPDGLDVLIGVYRTRKEARAAVRRVARKPGFAEYPEGFQIFPDVLGRDSWVDGFVTYTV